MLFFYKFFANEVLWYLHGQRKIFSGLWIISTLVSFDKQISHKSTRKHIIFFQTTFLSCLYFSFLPLAVAGQRTGNKAVIIEIKRDKLFFKGKVMFMQTFFFHGFFLFSLSLSTYNKTECLFVINCCRWTVMKLWNEFVPAV